VPLGRRELVERLRHAVHPDVAGDQLLRRDLPSASAYSVRANSSGVYPSTNCMLSSLLMPYIGSMRSLSMQTPTTTMRACGGADAMIW
jgi:hypothetical protein